MPYSLSPQLHVVNICEPGLLQAFPVQSLILPKVRFNTRFAEPICVASSDG